MITAITPTHSHIIPFTVFPAKNQTKEKSIHIITKIIIPLLLIYFLLHKFKLNKIAARWPAKAVA